MADKNLAMTSPEAVVIRPYADGDAEHIFDLIVPIQSEEFGIAITRADQPDLGQIPTYYQIGLGNFWVALDGDRIVGTISLKDIGNRQVALRKMFVAADYRGREKSVAKHLLDAALAWAREKGITDIFLGTTSKFLAAHRFYEKHGFTEITTDDLPPSFPLMKVDSKFYRYGVE